MGNHGVRLSKEIVKVAGRAMEKNFTSLGPYVLPISEQFKVVQALALRKVSGSWRLEGGGGPEAYTFEHFLNCELFIPQTSILVFFGVSRKSEGETFF